MKIQNLVTRHLRMLPVAVMAACLGTSAAHALDAKVAQSAFLKTPMMNGLKTIEFKAVGKHFTAKIGTRKHPALIFNTGTDKKPIWNAALYPKKLKMKDVYKSGAAAVLGGIVLSDPAVVMSSAKSSSKFTVLPKAVQDGIKKVFGKSIKTVTYPAGVNFSFIVKVKKTVGLAHLKTALGVGDKDSPMAGTMGADFIRFLVNGKAATKMADLASVSLSAVMPGIKPKLASKSFTSPNLVVSFRGAKDGQVQLVGGATITAVVGKSKLAFRTGLRFDPKAKNADTKMFTIFGPLAKPLKKPIDFSGRKAAVLSLNSAVMGNRRLTVGFSGTTDKKKPFATTAKLVKGRIVLEQAFADNLTVKDLLGYSQQALDKVPFKNPKKVGEVITGTVRLAGGDMEAFVFKAAAKAKKPFLALIPKAFSFGSWVPAVKGTPLDGAKVDKAALLVIPTGGGGDRALRELPKLVADKIVGVVGTKIIKGNKNKLPIADGLNLYTRVDVNKSNIMKFMFDKLQIKDKILTFVGSVNPVVFWVLPEKAGAQIKANKKVHEEILKTLRLATKISRAQIPGVDKFLEFEPGTLRFRGDAVYDRMGARTDVGDVEVVTEIISKIKVKLPGKTIGMQSQLNFHKGIADKSFEAKVIGTSTSDWKKAFGIPFLTLDNINLAATLNVDKKNTHTFVAGLGSKTKIGAQEVDSSIELVFEKKDKKKKGKSTGKKTWQVEDLVLSVPGKIELAKLPGIGKIPGLKDFVIENYTLSRAATQGTLIWKTIGYKGQAAIVSIEGKYTLFAKFPDLSLKKILKKMPKPLDALGDFKMPRAVLAFSTQKLTGYELVNMPDAAQDMLKDIIKNPSNEVPIWDGVTLIGAVGERDLPKNLHKVIADDLGVFKVIDGDLVLAGGINGIFGGNPKIGLYADLPGFIFPQNQPWARLVSFERAKANFFIRADAAATMLSLGVGGEMQLKVPHLDDPKKVDTLKFRGEGYVSADAVSAAGGVKVAGRMEGKWREPLGLKNFTFENPAVLVGADSEGSVEFGFGTTAEFAARNNQKLRFAGDFVTNINFSSTFPIPKKLGFRLQAKKLGPMAQMEVADAVFRGVMTGPMAKVVTQLIADPVARKSAQFLQKELAKRSLIDIFQVEKLPLPYMEFRDVDLFFATPGAVIPGRDDTLVGMGMVVAGKMSVNLMGQRFPIGEVDNRLTFKDGFKIYGKLEPRKLGPLKLRKAVVDVAANIEALPHFKIKADAALFGATEKLEIEVSKDKIGFFYDKNLGPVVKMRIDAKTVGKDLFRVKDFVVSASTKTSIDKIITKEVFPRFGIPKVVGDIMAKSTPLFIDGGTFEGSLTNFIKGGAVTLKLDHKYFGQRMKPAVIELRPVWKDPISAFPAIPIANEMRRSFLLFLATNPVNMPPVNLGLITVEQAQMTALATDPKDPKFVLKGKISNFLGATRTVNVALSDKGYAFALKDRIAGLWDADMKVRSIGGTAQSPNDIAYYGQVTNGFGTWIQKQVGGTLNKGSKAVSAGLTAAQRGLKTAEDGVRNADDKIISERAAARADLKLLQTPIKLAVAALRTADWLFDRARGALDAARRFERHICHHWSFVVRWGCGAAEKGVSFAVNSRDRLEDARDDAVRALSNLRRQLERERAVANVDWHPRVSFWIFKREAELKLLAFARLTMAGANELNTKFNGVTQSLVRVAAGTDTLNVKKVVIKGQLKQLKTEFHMLADIMGKPNVYMPIKVNLSNPADTDVRGLANFFNAVIRGKGVKRLANNMPPPPKLPVDTVTQAEIVAAVRAAAMEKIRLLKAARAKEDARKQQLAAATQPKPPVAGGMPANRNAWAIGKDRIGNDWGIYRWNGRSWGKMPGNSTHIAAGPNNTAVSVDVSGSTHFWDGGRWSSLPGSHSDATIAADGTIYTLGRGAPGKDSPIYRWDVSRWTKMPGTLAQISAGPNGTLYGTAADHRIYRWDGRQWRRMPGAARDISVADDGTMWAIGTTKRGANFNIMKWDGRAWKNMSGESAQISAGPNGTAVAIDAGGPAHYWNGSKWVHLRGSSRDVSMAKVGVPRQAYTNIYVAGNNNAKSCFDSSAGGGDLGAIRCQNHRNLRWAFWTDGTIRHGPQGLCVTAKNGGRAYVARCDDSTDQKWSIRWSGGAGPSSLDPTWRFRIVHIASGLCLQEGGNRNTTVKCGGTDNANTWPAAQTWRAMRKLPLPAGEANMFRSAQLVNAHSGQCADENSGKLTRGGPVIMWTCNSSGQSRNRQLWSHTAEGQVKTTNGLCLDVKNPKVTRGMAIIIWGCNGSGAPMQRQRWRQLKDGRIQHVQSGYCLDSTDNANQRGRLVLSTCSTTPTQKWQPRGASS